MSFLSVLPIATLLGFALLGFYNYFNTLGKHGLKIELFNEYRNALVAFYNKYVADNKIDGELRHYLLENVHEVYSYSGASISESNAYSNFSRDIQSEIINIVNFRCYNFTESCNNVESILIVCIGAFKKECQNIRSKIFNPIHLVRNGISLILNMLPIVNRIPRKITGFLSDLFIFITVVDTISSVVMKKKFLLDLVRQIPTWISQRIL